MTTRTEEFPNEPIAIDWARFARRARLIALRRLVVRIAFGVTILPGLFQLYVLVRWGISGGYLGLLVQIVVHVLALAAALGLPDASPQMQATNTFLGNLSSRYTDRAARLGALLQAIVVESALFLAGYPLVELITGSRLQWGAPSVAAVAFATVVWPLWRIAVAQRNEARKLTGLYR